MKEPLLLVFLCSLALPVFSIGPNYRPETGYSVDDETVINVFPDPVPVEEPSTDEPYDNDSWGTTKGDDREEHPAYTDGTEEPGYAEEETESTPDPEVDGTEYGYTEVQHQGYNPYQDPYPEAPSPAQPDHSFEEEESTEGTTEEEEESTTSEYDESDAPVDPCDEYPEWCGLRNLPCDDCMKESPKTSEEDSYEQTEDGGAPQGNQEPWGTDQQVPQEEKGLESGSNSEDSSTPCYELDCLNEEGSQRSDVEDTGSNPYNVGGSDDQVESAAAAPGPNRAARVKPKGLNILLQ